MTLQIFEKIWVLDSGNGNPCAEFSLGNMKIHLHFSALRLHRLLKLCPMENKDLFILYNKYYNIVADVLATQGARASAAMTWQSWNI